MKCIVVFLFVVISSPILSQESFADLPAKKRISIAEQEEIEAKADEGFQKMMMEGHELFKAKHYLKAIRKYEEAKEKRPYNVYPKVIIDDIELSMKDTLKVLRAAEKEELLRKAANPSEEKVEEPKESVVPEETREERLEKMDDWEAMEREKRERAREEEEAKPEIPPVKKSSAGDVPNLSMADFQKDLAKRYPEGVTETIEKEGNRTVTTRIFVADGKGSEYKKVVHDWGGVFYFKNGEAVTERVWKSETER
jgi:hypothetical protein